MLSLQGSDIDLNRNSYCKIHKDNMYVSEIAFAVSHSHLTFSQHEEVQLMYAGYSCYASVEW